MRFLSSSIVVAATTAVLLAGCNASTLPSVPAGRPAANLLVRRSATGDVGLKAHIGATLTTADGQQIFGFDIAQDNASGVLASTTHIETFDSQTGKITASFPKVTPRGTTYGMDGIFQNDVALVTRYVVPKGSIYAKRFYDLISPFTADKFTGNWTPPVKDIDVQQAAIDPASTTSALFAIELQHNDVPDLVVSDVGANTFSKVIHLDPNLFSLGDGPQLGAGIVGGAAYFALSPDGGAVGGAAPVNVAVNLTTGHTVKWVGFNLGPFGAGYVNGAASDPNTGIAATTTELNAQVEFYDVRHRKDLLATQLPCTSNGDQSFSAAGVGVDTVHKLFLVADPGYGCDGGKDGALVVYDEKGNLVETLSGFKFFIAEPAPAIDMKKRMGWFFGPGFDQLTQFFY